MLNKQNLLISMLKELEGYNGVFEEIIKEDTSKIPAMFFLVVGPEHQIAKTVDTGEYTEAYLKNVLRDKNDELTLITAKEFKDLDFYKENGENNIKALTPIDYFDRWSGELTIGEVKEIDDEDDIYDTIEELDDILCYYKQLCKLNNYKI